MGTTLQLPDIAILVFFGHISFSISCHKICLSAPVLILNKTEGEKLFALSQEFPPPPEGEFVHFCDNTVWVRKAQRDFFVKHSFVLSMGSGSEVLFSSWCTVVLFWQFCREFTQFSAYFWQPLYRVVFLTGPPDFQYQNEKTCSANEELFYIESFVKN